MSYKNLKAEEEIFKTFLELNPIIKGDVRNPYLICLAGITGTGKSTIARMLSQKKNSVVLNNDKVRQFIYKTSFSQHFEDIQRLVKKIQYYRIEQTLINGNNCLLDGDISNNFEVKKSKIEKFNYPYYIIKLNYDRDVVIKRIQRRKKYDEASSSFSGSETLNYSSATVKDFLRMEKEKYDVPNEYIFFEIDMTGDFESVEKQVDELVKKLNSLEQIKSLGQGV